MRRFLRLAGGNRLQQGKWASWAERGKQRGQRGMHKSKRSLLGSENLGNLPQKTRMNSGLHLTNHHLHWLNPQNIFPVKSILLKTKTKETTHISANGSVGFPTIPPSGPLQGPRGFRQRPRHQNRVATSSSRVCGPVCRNRAHCPVMKTAKITRK